MRVIIIEDDALFSEILQTFLETNQCTTIVADSVDSAKLHLQSSQFDFVLLDNHLPDGNGIHFIEHIKTKLPFESAPPVMMITADENQSVMVKAFDRGADDFLVKPLSLDLLWQKMVRVKSLYDKEQKLKEQATHLESMLNKQEQEEKLARYVYEHVAATASKDMKGVETYLQSSSAFNGDVFVSDMAPNGNVLIMLADATGHGLSAAISIIPLIATMKAMIRKGLSLAHIIHEANAKLCLELPDDKFVALIGVEFNIANQSIDLFNGGMPDVIAIHHDKSIVRYPSTSMSLGILDPEDFDPNITTIESHMVKHLFYFSDGLIEQQNSIGEEFGMDRVISLLEANNGKEPLLSHVVNHFSVFNEMRELQDDLSICDLQVDTLTEAERTRPHQVDTSKSGKVIASVQLNGAIIGCSDIVGCFDSLMRCLDVAGDVRQRAFTVFAELISNALDHGILDLDSKLKNDISGFADYMMLKEERLACIGDKESLDMVFTYTPASNEVHFKITDTGSGYALDAQSQMTDGALSGRGLSLIKKLCKSVEVTPPGNQTSVAIKREF